MLIVFSFIWIIIAGLGIGATWSHEQFITYVYGYSNLTMSMLFGTFALTVMVLSGRITDDFAKECHSKTGMAYQIDSLYKSGGELMCTD